MCTYRLVSKLYIKSYIYIRFYPPPLSWPLLPSRFVFATLLTVCPHKLARERSNGTYLTAGLGGAVLLVLVLLAGLMLYRRRQRIMEAEFVAMRADLNQYAAQSRNTLPDPEKPPLEKVAHPLLSDRQQAVLTCLMAGMSNKDIAQQLNVSENTVKYHIKNIYQLLEIK